MANVGAELCGNYERSVMHPTALAAGKPEFIRGKLIPNMYYYESIPQDAKVTMAKSDFVVITNWSTLAHFVTPPGTNFVVHAPSTSFVKGILLDMAVIFKADTRALWFN